MKLFSAWPRWAQYLGATIVAVAAFGTGVAVDYRSGQPVITGKTALAQQFEAQPRQWLDHPRDASEFEQAINARTLGAVGVDGLRVLASRRSCRLRRPNSCENPIALTISIASSEARFRSSDAPDVVLP